MNKLFFIDLNFYPSSEALPQTDDSRRTIFGAFSEAMPRLRVTVSRDLRLDAGYRMLDKRSSPTQADIKNSFGVPFLRIE